MADAYHYPPELLSLLVATWAPRLAEGGKGSLKRQMEKPLLIVWDGAAIHRSRKLNAWLEGLNGHIALARLPAYAPELNPVEAIWAYLKKHEIANLCLNTIGEVGQFARNRLKSMQRRPALIDAFWKQAERSVLAARNLRHLTDDATPGRAGQALQADGVVPS